MLCIDDEYEKLMANDVHDVFEAKIAGIVGECGDLGWFNAYQRYDDKNEYIIELYKGYNITDQSYTIFYAIDDLTKWKRDVFIFMERLKNADIVKSCEFVPCENIQDIMDEVSFMLRIKINFVDVVEHVSI